MKPTYKVYRVWWDITGLQWSPELNIQIDGKIRVRALKFSIKEPSIVLFQGNQKQCLKFAKKLRPNDRKPKRGHPLSKKSLKLIKRGKDAVINQTYNIKLQDSQVTRINACFRHARSPSGYFGASKKPF